MSATTTALPTGTWNVDPAHSRIGFSVKHLGISTVRGEFGTYEGQIVIDDDGNAKASGKIDVSSVDTSVADRDAHLLAPDFFDAENYPEITFESTSITATDDDEYEITGDLTLRGTTKPITLTAEAGGSEVDPFGNTRIGLEASGTISRGDYGMKFNQALGSGNLAVSDKVKLQLDISAVKAS